MKTSANYYRPLQGLAFAAMVIVLLITSQTTRAAKPNNPVCSIITVNIPNINDDASSDPACDSQVCVYTGGTV